MAAATSGPTSRTAVSSSSDAAISAVERPEVLRQRRGGRLAHLADAERDEEAGQRGLLAALELRQQVLGRLLAHALEADQRRLVEVVEIGEVAHQAALDQLVDQLLAEPLDVHRAARPEEAQRLLDARRAGDVQAAIGDLVLLPDDVGAADGAVRRHAERLLVARRCVR